MKSENRTNDKPIKEIEALSRSLQSSIGWLVYNLEKIKEKVNAKEISEAELKKIIKKATKNRGHYVLVMALYKQKQDEDR